MAATITKKKSLQTLKIKVLHEFSYNQRQKSVKRNQKVENVQPMTPQHLTLNPSPFTPHPSLNNQSWQKSNKTIS